MRAVTVTFLFAACVAAWQQEANPMARVATLLENLAKKIDTDGKNELDLFEKYVCWYKTVVSAKKQANKAAADRISSLESYIDDISSGRIEFTNERVNLEAETGNLDAEIAKSLELRTKENEDFLAAKDEMEKAIGSLEKAVEVLGDATKDMKEGVLLIMGSDLKQTLSIGQTFLNKADSRFLNEVLVAGPKEEVGGMLAKDGKFDEKYKARSSKIQEILADMLQTFKDNLEDAEKKEMDTQIAFDTLSVSKKKQADAAHAALGAGAAEDGQRNLNKQEATDEKKMLETRTTTDKKFVKQAEDAYKVMNEEWVERQRLRTAEVASISEALGVLRSDDARDIGKKSFASQGFLLQVKSSSSCARHADTAIATLKKAAKQHRDLRLNVLVLQLQNGASKKRFAKVTKSIDKMVSDLHAEEDEDLEVKEKCEEDRMANTKVAKKTSQDIDDETAFIGRKNAQIAALKEKIATLEKNTKDLETQTAVAQSNRNAENREFETAKGDDLAAKGLVEKTITVLKKFYEDEGLSLMQAKVKSHRMVQPVVVAGEAPPPPPATWSDGGYQGSQGESNGIQAILSMIVSDIEKDMRTAQAEEDKSKELFDEYESDNQSTIDGLTAQKVEYESETGDKEGDITTSKSMRSDKKKILDDTMAFLKSIAPSCDYMAVNFELRKQNRAEEIEGLAEAKNALSGAKFGFLQDPSDDCDPGN